MSHAGARIHSYDYMRLKVLWWKCLYVYHDRYHRNSPLAYAWFGLFTIVRLSETKAHVIQVSGWLVPITIKIHVCNLAPVRSSDESFYVALVLLFCCIISSDLVRRLLATKNRKVHSQIIIAIIQWCLQENNIVQDVM